MRWASKALRKTSSLRPSSICSSRRPPAAGQDVEVDVQDMVGLVIGEMPLEHVDHVIKVADQARPLSQQQHGADAAGAQALNTLTQLVVDVGGSDHGLVAFGAGSIRNAVENSPLAFFQELANLYRGLPTAFASWDRFRDNHHHSKPSVARNNENESRLVKA
jgi:hypothetical protein